MSAFGWIIVLVGALTLLGSGALLFITLRYYWGERGAPPLTGEARKRQKDEELKLRSRQIEYAAKNPREPRKPSFLDNRKKL